MTFQMFLNENSLRMAALNKRLKTVNFGCPSVFPRWDRNKRYILHTTSTYPIISICTCIMVCWMSKVCVWRKPTVCSLCKHCDMTWNEPCTYSTVQSNYNKQIKTSVEIIIFISLVREICYSSFHGCTHVPMK